jgi:hypothetical protein
MIPGASVSPYTLVIPNRFFLTLCHSEPRSGEESAFLGVRSDSAGGQN